MTISKQYFPSSSFANSSLVGGQWLTSSHIDISALSGALGAGRIMSSYVPGNANGQVQMKMELSPDLSYWFQYGDTVNSTQGQSANLVFDSIFSSVKGVRALYREIGMTSSAGSVTAELVVSYGGTVDDLETAQESLISLPGDLIIGDATGTQSVLRKGSNGQALVISSGSLQWANVSGGGGSGTSPGGNSGEFQYNNGGSFSGASALKLVGSQAVGTGSFSGSFTGTFADMFTTRDLSVYDPNWQASSAYGSFTLNNSSQTLDFSVNAYTTGYGLGAHAVFWSSPDVDFRCRIASKSSDKSDDDIHVLLSNTVAGSGYCGLRLFMNGNLCVVNESTYGSQTNIPNILSGEGWVRLLQRGAQVYVYGGVGSAGQQPTSWTPVGMVVYSTSIMSPWTYIRFQIDRVSTSSSPYTLQVDKLTFAALNS